MDDITKFVIDYLDQDIARCEDFRDQKIKPDVLERYKKFFAETSYFESKFPKLAKQSSLVSHDVMSTIDGAMPPIMKILMGSDEVIKIEGAESEDTGNAEIMEKLISYQLMRKNDMFNIMYDWVKDSLITGMGIVKCYWERETKDQQVTETMSIDALNQAYEAGLQIVEVVPADEFGNFDVTFIQQFYTKNQPRIENVMLSEFLFDPEARSIDECSFIAQKKRVTASYLREKEKQGLYANVEEAIKQGDEDVNVDEIEEEVTELDISAYGYQDNARKKKIIYECFVDIDINEDGILEKMIITKCGKTILRMEPNVYGRHPFFEMIPVKEPFRVWPKQSFVDRVAQWQDLKTAMIKQMAVNIALSNDPRVVVDEQSINLSDLIEGRNWLRKKSGATMADAVMPMPPIPLSSATFPMLEYADTQKEQDTGVTRYNQGLDARSLNKMLDINTPVPMADGTYKLLRDIVDGDMVVGKNGKPTKVIKAHEIHFPERAYDITFESGETIKAGGEHLWTITTGNDRKLNKNQTVDTDTVYHLFKSQKSKIHIPRVSRPEITNPYKPLLDPYVLGVWLGDGHSYAPRITTADKEVIDYVSKWANGDVIVDKTQNARAATTYYIHGLYPYLKELKLIKKNGAYSSAYIGNEKHIPEEYFRASYEDRMELLRGIMDTDGCHHSGGTVIFTQKEGKLIDDVARLIDGLGGWAQPKREMFPGKLAKHNTKYYQLTFTTQDNPFKLSIKAGKWVGRKKSVTSQTIREITLVEKTLMRCLTVDANDGLFCVGRKFTVTHNTASGINSIMNASNQRMELMVRRMAETGIRKLFRFMITLNQKFIDVDTVIRLTNETLNISPEDLSGEFDLVVNAGMGITSKESTMMSLQTLLTALLQVGAQGIPVATPTNIYNIFKKWVETVGLKDTNTYLTDPAIQQQRMMMEQAIKMQVLASMPPEIMAYYYQNATLPPEVLMAMPPQIQVLFGGNYGQQGAMVGGGAPGGTGGGSVGVAQGLPAFGTSGDNRTLQNYANLNDGGTIGTANRTQPVGQVPQ